MTAPRVVLLTSNGRRHAHASQTLADRLNVVGIVREKKRAAIPSAESLSTADLAVLERHLQEREGVEATLLGSPQFPEDVDSLEVNAGEVNSDPIVRWVEDRAPDLVLLYGTSIIRPPLLEKYAGQMINIHLGLSPYYRGAATNFWPLVHALPECAGATIHLAVPEVDAGPILTQVRPELVPQDRAHEIGTKAMVAGVESLARAAEWFHSGRLTPVPQRSGEGKLFRRRDFNADAVRRLWTNLDAGMVRDYLDAAEERRGRFPILQPI